MSGDDPPAAQPYTGDNPLLKHCVHRDSSYTQTLCNFGNS